MRTSTVLTNLYAGILLLTLALVTPPTAIAADQQVQLTAGEQQFIRMNPVIRMCVDPHAMPYELLDANGRHLGMVPRYIELFARRTGLKFELVPTSTWSETLSLVHEHSCDMISALNETPDRATYLAFTRPYIRAWAALAVRNEGADTIWGLEYMDGRKLAVVEDDFHEEVVARDYPEIQLVHVADIDEGLEKVKNSEVDAAIGPLLMVAYHVRKLDLDDLEIVGRTRYENLLRVGVRRDYPLLVSILDKAIATLTPEDALRIRREVFR